MNDDLRLKNLGLNIKINRIKFGISQEELAEKANLSRNLVSLIETGKINPTILKILDISKVLNIPIEELTKNID